MKSYFLSGIIFLLAFWFNRQAFNRNNNILLNGITEKVAIVDKTKDCLNSTRNSNRATVVTKSQNSYTVSLSYSDCNSLQIGDSIPIRYIRGEKDVLRVYNYDSSPKKVNYFQWVLLSISICFFFGAAYSYKKKNT